MPLKISIVMPVLNGQKYVGLAIESILAQTYKSYELMVVDDGSTDGTRECIQQFATKLELKYVYHATPQGIPKSMNDGIRHSSGDMIAFLDHDDLWMPEFLEKQTDHLRDQPDLGMVYSDFQTIDPAGSIIEESVAVSRKRTRPSGDVFRQLFLDSFIVGNSVLIRKECFNRLGMFDETLRWGDYHMWLRIALHYRVGYTPKSLTKYRQHPSQSTRTPSARDLEDPVAIVALRKLLDSYPEARRRIGEKEIKRRMAVLYFDTALIWWSRDMFKNARHFARKAIRLTPAQSSYYLFYAACLLRPSHSKQLREVWHRARGLFHRSPELDWTKQMQAPPAGAGAPFGTNSDPIERA
jgi:glycosyltransferase involved in cell wall biosynthesis